MIDKVVLIGDDTVGDMKVVLRDALVWLEIDAKYAHSKSRIRQFRENVAIVIQKIERDEIKYLGKKFTVEVPGDIPAEPIDTTAISDPRD